MARRIILVDLFWTRDKDPRIPLGHASLLAALRRVEGVEAVSVVVPVNSDPRGADVIAVQLLAHASGCSPRSVDIAIGAYVWGEELLRTLLGRLRDMGFGGRIILGGPQISYAGSGLERLYPAADVFVRGYGEEALVRLARFSGRVAIPGVHWARDVDAVLQADVNLERLASPWLAGTISLIGQKFIRWETQRGCPFRCSFCQHREPGARLLRRALSWDRVCQEIDLFCESGVEQIAVLDPIFNVREHGAAVLARFAERGFRGHLSLQCRAEYVDEEFLEAAAALDVTLEFGLQTIHPAEGEAVERRNHIGKVDEVLEKVRQRGIKHEVSLIFGLPLQTLASFKQSVAWCLERRVPVIKAFPLLLLRGTQLDRERDRWGFVDDGAAMPMVVASASFSRDDQRAMAQIAEALNATEGRHPELADLLRRARDLDPVPSRWQAPSTSAKECAA